MSSISNRPIDIERVLVLSGGGGRGAYQVGVCQWLDGKWQPDMVLGTSIGATNGAMLIAPKTESSGTAQLEKVWRNDMVSKKIQAVAGEWSWLLRLVIAQSVEVLLKYHATPECGSGHASLLASIRDVTSEVLSEGDEVSVEEFRKLLDIKPWLKQQLSKPAVMERDHWCTVLCDNVDFDRLKDLRSPYLGVTAVDAETGALQMFWNRVPKDVKGTPSGIEVRHLMASSSIPGIYRPTMVDGRYYWDGALAANTPIAPAIEVGATDIIVVLMTPWIEQPKQAGGPSQVQPIPTVYDALQRFLDWMILASLRRELSRKKKEQRVRIVAPDSFQGIVSLLDYDEADSDTLIECGARDAKNKLGPLS